MSPPTTAFALRPYQQEAVEAVSVAVKRGLRRPLISLPTGTGKTIVFAHLVADKCRKEQRSVILAHRDELIEQAVGKLQAVMPSADIGIVKAEKNEIDHAVIVASVQTLSRPRRLEQLHNGFALVVVDEAHHATASTYRRIIEKIDAPLTLGVTATPERADGGNLGDVFDEIIYRKEILEMIQGGYLCDLRAKRIQVKADFASLRVQHGDFAEGETGRMLLDANAPERVAEALIEHAPDRKALVFTSGVELAHAMAHAINEKGIRAEALDGTTPTDERRAMLDRFRGGGTQVIANCAVLTEGFDEATISAIVIARPTRSRPLYQQMIGRGTRRCVGKPDCLILDLVGATSRHDLVTADSLFSVTEELLEGRTVTEAIREQREQRQAQLLTPGQLVANDVELFAQRKFAWVASGQQRFALSLGDAGMLVIEPDGEQFAVLHNTRETSRQLYAVGSLELATGLAEDFARKNGATRLARRAAPWRTKPPTDGQLRALRNMKIRKRAKTRGQASDLISRASAQIEAERRQWGSAAW